MLNNKLMRVSVVKPKRGLGSRKTLPKIITP